MTTGEEDIVERLKKKASPSAQSADTWRTEYDPIYQDALDFITRLREGEKGALRSARAEVIEECARKIDGKADLYKAYSEEAARAGDKEKADRMWLHYQTTWEDAKDIRALSAPLIKAPSSSTSRRGE